MINIGRGPDKEVIERSIDEAFKDHGKRVCSRDSNATGRCVVGILTAWIDQWPVFHIGVWF